MTVQELIIKLLQMPMDKRVILQKTEGYLSPEIIYVDVEDVVFLPDGEYDQREPLVEIY
jgi:hypothetical protein